MLRVASQDTATHPKAALHPRPQFAVAEREYETMVMMVIAISQSTRYIKSSAFSQGREWASRLQSEVRWDQRWAEGSQIESSQ